MNICDPVVAEQNDAANNAKLAGTGANADAGKQKERERVKVEEEKQRKEKEKLERLKMGGVGQLEPSDLVKLEAEEREREMLGDERVEVVEPLSVEEIIESVASASATVSVYLVDFDPVEKGTETSDGEIHIQTAPNESVKGDS